MEAKYAGVQVKIAGQDFVIPGLSFKQMRELTESGRIEKFAAITGMPTVEQQGLLLDLLTETMKRNHPSVGREFLEESVAVADAIEIVKIIFTTSGLVTSPNVKSPQP